MALDGNRVLVGAPNDDTADINIGQAHLFEVDSATTVPLDIKPGSCPNPISAKSRGVVPAAIPRGGIEITDVDIASVRLAGISPIRIQEASRILRE